MTTRASTGVYRPQLANVTLICVDTVNPALALYAMRRSMQLVDFGAAIFVTHPGHGLSDIPAGLTVVTDEPVRSYAEYSLFMLQRLRHYVRTSHCLTVQWDGFVRDPAMWSDEFLTFDYIGAVWSEPGRRVGNGGFSLRSRLLLEALTDDDIHHFHPEDRCIAQRYAGLLEQRHGIRFADEATAHRFSAENVYELPSSFGFHGLVHRALSAQGLDELIAQAPGKFFSTLNARTWIKDALKSGQTDIARRLLRRRRAHRKLDLSDVRLWLRLYRARLLDQLRSPGHD